MLYEIFTGKVPFTGDSPIAVGFQQLNEQPVKPADVNPKIPAAIENIILKALRKDPAQRFASVSEMRVELEEAFHRAVSFHPKRNGTYKRFQKRLSHDEMSEKNCKFKLSIGNVPLRAEIAENKMGSSLQNSPVLISVGFR